MLLTVQTFTLFTSCQDPACTQVAGLPRQKKDMGVAFMLEAILGWLPSRASHVAQHQQASSKQDTLGELVLPRKGATAPPTPAGQGTLRLLILPQQVWEGAGSARPRWAASAWLFITPGVTAHIYVASPEPMPRSHRHSCEVPPCPDASLALGTGL